MIASPQHTDGPYTVTPARESGPDVGGPGDTGIVAHIDGEPVVIGETWDEGIKPNGDRVPLPGRANAVRLALAGNACASLQNAELESGMVEAAIRQAGDR